jgi:hypothetical protein
MGSIIGSSDLDEALDNLDREDLLLRLRAGSTLILPASSAQLDEPSGTEG